MKRWRWPLLFALSALGVGALAAPPPDLAVPARPELAQSLPLIRVPEAHALGITGRGVGVLVIDNFTPNPDDPCNDFVHGEWVRGILEAVAPEARVFTLDVPLSVPGSGDRPCYSFRGGDLELALRDALATRRELGIQIINYSIGGGRFTDWCEGVGEIAALIRRLVQEGVLFVTAAGNAGYRDALGFPECMHETLSVGAVYDYTDVEPEEAAVCAQPPEVDQVTCYSNSAYFLDVLAPGSWISVPGGPESIGTSAAAPHVSGVLALLRQLDPTLTLAQARELLRRTGVPVYDARNGLTFPRVDAFQAVEALLAQRNRPPSVSLEIAPAQPTTADTVTLSARASDPDGDALVYAWSLDGQPLDDGQPEIRWVRPPAGTHTVTVHVEDGRGGAAEASAELRIAGPASPDAALLAALDRDGDRRLGDGEILEAVRWWVTGEPVPGAGAAVDDEAIARLIALWISGTPF